MILADTSIWVNHFRRGDAQLARLLTEDEIGLHPFVLGEIAAGTLRHRARVLADLACLPQLAVVEEREVHHLLESRQLWSLGLGWVDLHLLAAALLARWNLLTVDHAMKHAAARLLIPCV